MAGKAYVWRMVLCTDDRTIIPGPGTCRYIICRAKNMLQALVWVAILFPDSGSTKPTVVTTREGQLTRVAAKDLPTQQVPRCRCDVIEPTIIID